MTFKRNYTIKPIPVGHPRYIEGWGIHEITVKEGDDYALFYMHINKDHNVLDIIKSIEDLSWEILDDLTEFDRGIK